MKLVTIALVTKAPSCFNLVSLYQLVLYETTSVVGTGYLYAFGEKLELSKGKAFNVKNGEKYCDIFLLFPSSKRNTHCHGGQIKDLRLLISLCMSLSPALHLLLAAGETTHFSSTELHRLALSRGDPS